MAKLSTDFTEALNVPLGEIERPPLIPVGIYRAVVTKIPSYDTIGDDWDVIDFQMRLLEMKDGDQQELEAYGGLTETSVLRNRFMFSKDKTNPQSFNRSMYNVKRFCLEHLRVEGNDRTPLKQLLNDSVNHQCLVQVKWQADRNDPETQYNQIGRTAPLE